MSATRATSPAWEGFIYLVTGTALFVALLMLFDLASVMFA